MASFLGYSGLRILENYSVLRVILIAQLPEFSVFVRGKMLSLKNDKK